MTAPPEQRPPREQANVTVPGAGDTLAAAIEREHRAAHAAARTAIEHAIRCGELLIQAKDQLPHGGWLDWLKANTSISTRQSQRYMRIAKNDTVSHLTIRGALDAIADHRDDQPEAPDRWWAKPAVDRAMDCYRRPDMRNAECLYLLLRGDPPDQIAELLGLDVREVECSLFPQIERTYPPLAEEFALSLLAHWRAMAASGAADRADRRGRDDIRAAAKVIERESWARHKIHEQRFWPALFEQYDKAAQVHVLDVAIGRAREAHGLENGPMSG